MHVITDGWSMGLYRPLFRGRRRPIRRAGSGLRRDAGRVPRPGPAPTAIAARGAALIARHASRGTRRAARVARHAYPPRTRTYVPAPIIPPIIIAVRDRIVVVREAARAHRAR
eukprot:gene9282-biopygen8465